MTQTTKPISARATDLSADDIMALTDANIIKIADQENPNWRQEVEVLRNRINQLIEDHNART